MYSTYNVQVPYVRTALFNAVLFTVQYSVCESVISEPADKVAINVILVVTEYL
jgi:hypothetical protein